jgi:hypothetical protein
MLSPKLAFDTSAPDKSFRSTITTFGADHFGLVVYLLPLKLHIDIHQKKPAVQYTTANRLLTQLKQPSFHVISNGLSNGMRL